MKLKVGHKVKIRKDLVANRCYGGVVVTQAMIPFCGTYVEIKRIDYEDDFNIVGLPSNLFFSPLMCDEHFKYGK